MKTEPNDTVFPSRDEYNFPVNGLTKREYFAAMAMQGYLASVPSDVVERPEYAASHAVKYADALINALNKKE